ncbi:phage tail protein X [Rhodobiaceae bacterium]|nr:phage tail protein X [Rhodobiaceae bacterium]
MSVARAPFPENGITHALQGDTVDLICARFYGRTDGVTEAVLDMNRGLASLGAVLPHGTPVTLPSPRELAPSKPKTINLWD